MVLRSVVHFNSTQKSRLKLSDRLFFIYSAIHILTDLFRIIFVHFSIYLGISYYIKSISLFSLTNFNFLSHISLHEFDILTLSTMTFFGVTAIATTILSVYTCMKLMGNSTKKNLVGFMGFLLLFFLYQIFWVASIFTILFRKKVTWR